MYTQSTAKEMHMLLILAHEALRQKGEVKVADKIDAYLDSLEPAERKSESAQPNQPVSTRLTTSEYAAIHAVNKLFKGFK